MIIANVELNLFFHVSLPAVRKVTSQMPQHPSFPIKKGPAWVTGEDGGDALEHLAGQQHPRLHRNCYCSISKAAKEPVRWSSDSRRG